MKNNKAADGSEGKAWRFRFLLALGLQGVCVILILLANALGGFFAAVTAITLMPLYECALGFFFAFFTNRATDRRWGILGVASGALVLAGLVYYLADLALNHWLWYWNWPMFWSNLVPLAALLLGCVWGFRVETMRRKAVQRRSECHER